MDTKRYHIAQFGTYDIESLGDTSFPKMLAYGLEKYIPCDIELFSMTECAKPYNHNSHVYSFEQFHERHSVKPFDAVIIGGGEFIHFSKMDVIIDGVQKSYPEGHIWKKPLEMAIQHGIPAFLNCVGVPYDLTSSQQQELRDHIKTVLYASVRDEYSTKRLRAAGVEDVHCVADNLWYMNQMYPKVQMDQMRHELELRTGRDFSTPYIIVQYGTTRDSAALAEQLHRIKADTGFRICLMPINYCHEDRYGMELLAQHGVQEFETITDYFQPPELIAIIAGAKAFFGTSLHGNLTAASYGVPFVGIDMYPSFVSKMDGIFSMMGYEHYLCPHEDGIKAAYDAQKKDMANVIALPGRIQDLQKKLDLHFQRIADLLKGAR